MMQDLFNAVLRAYVKVALNVYFNRIRVHGAAHIPKKKAVLLVANHQNALIDPILLATHTRLNPYFLTRASVFRKSFVAKILNFIRMIPVYRVRDGLRNMEKNQESFEKSVEVLRKKGCMIIFGEGNHGTSRSLRPLKKGFVRIAFQALQEDPELDLVVLPVGINYTNHQASGSEVGIYFGEAIPAQPYLGKPLQLLRAVETALQPLVSQIPEEEHAEITQALIKRKVKLSDPKLFAKACLG
ncbi:phospholipid/glycerol acyltransferase [Nitritalea halalkaliphila LW7]|uniref:Phospholipid/glycerol acyltransferase n=1 Tax=Nitritalea halalkaliphila LW7 TaxID=1189621 RepID=I5C3Q7_9BACT|nr:1-acyl-sn-glycerol-3-phosphate acyltransferase [Nitritalea halalkaliphila]EIM76459.1 phospholipid/glycerol acyltransferase [Nitritalea halalkaliphila LW7]